MIDTLLQFIDTISWPALLLIVWADILLGGDNAIVIALACRNLPPHQRKLGVIWGTAGAILLRVVLILFALELLKIDYLKLAGGALLIWIGVKLLADSGNNQHDEVASADNLWNAFKTILMADLVMSVDNVLAIAAAATSPSVPVNHQMGYVIFGLIVSIPIVMWGSSVVLKLMDRFPMIVVFGAGLIGWIAGGMMITDNVFSNWLDASGQKTVYVLIAEAVGVALVVAIGFFLKNRQKKSNSSI